MTSSTMTTQNYVDHWLEELTALFSTIADAAALQLWQAEYSETKITEEDPFGAGTRISYDAPVLVLTRADTAGGGLQRITFEPRHRNTLGSAGRIDVYSYPQLRDAMLLRVPQKNEAPPSLTAEQAIELVAARPWKAFTQERMPLQADLTSNDGVCGFLEDLVATR